VKAEYLKVLLQCKVKMQTLAVVNTGALNFVKLDTEDMDQVPIHKDGGLLWDSKRTFGYCFSIWKNILRCIQLSSIIYIYIYFQMPFISFVL